MDEIFEQSLLMLSMLMTAISAMYLLWSSLGVFSSSNSKHLQVVGQITNLTADAKRKESDNFEWDDLRKNEKAFNKDTIFTGSSSELSLKLKNGGVLKVGGNTLIFLSQDVTGLGSAKASLTEISLVRGKIDYVGADQSSSNASSIAINLGSTKISGNGVSAYQVVREADNAQVISKVGQVQITSGLGKDSQKILLSPHEYSSVKNITSDSTQNSSIQKQRKIIPIQTLSLTETNHVAVKGDLSQVTRAIPLLSETILFGKKTKETQTVALAEPVTVPTRKRVAAQAPEPPAPKVVQFVSQKQVTAAPIVHDNSGLSGQASVSKNGFELDPTSEAKFIDKLNPISLSWKCDVKEMGQFNIQFSSSVDFGGDVFEYKTSEDEITSTKGDRASYVLDFEPNKFVHLKGFLETAYRNKFIFWRIVPVDKNGTAQGALQNLPVQKMTFKFSPKADIKSGIGMYSEPTDSNSIVIAKWTLKNVIPSQYEVTLSASPDLSNPLCKKIISKEIFQGSKPKGPMAIVFNEQSILESSDDCKIDDVLKAKKKLYYGVTAQDLAGRDVQFTSPDKAIGSLNLL